MKEQMYEWLAGWLDGMDSCVSGCINDRGKS